MMEFCSSILNPTITCSTVSTDGYEVTNLISSDVDKRQKGFLAYYAIRPPVTITIKFICNINVSHIILWSQVNYQKSIGFEIYASPSCESEPQDFQKVSFGYVEENEVGIIFFRGIHYDGYDRSTRSLNRFARKAIPGNTYALLNSTNSMQIKIIKTKSSVPALAKVEVWGQPSRSCNQSIQRNVSRLWANRILKTEPKLCELVREPENDSATKAQFEVPEEFLDSITCTIMTIPFTLPSGNVVDQSTLERYEQEEAKWGRIPSDPFTGKIFTETSRPIPATSLKARIDRFLTEHSDKQELLFIPRTTGKKERCNIHQVSSLSSVSLTLIKPSVSRDTADLAENKEMSCPSTSKGISSLGKKRPRHRDEDMMRSKVLCKESQEEISDNIQQDTDPILSTHEEKIDRSLSNALESTLASLPTFTRFNSCKTTIQCSTCYSDEMLFRLPCDHFICRNCLLLKKKSSNLSCSLCTMSFQSGDPVRYHV